MDPLAVYRIALDAIVSSLSLSVGAVIRAGYDPDDKQGSIDRLTPEITALVRASRRDAYRRAGEMIRAVAQMQGVDNPYVPSQSGYTEDAVRTVLRETLNGPADDAARSAAARLSSHAEDSGRQTVMRTVEDGKRPAEGMDRAYSATDEVPENVTDPEPDDTDTEPDEPDDEPKPAKKAKVDRTSLDYLRGLIEDPQREFREMQAKSWARVLTGAENCAFCVMLASRGPVYSSAESAGRLNAAEALSDADAKGFANTFHFSCDCVVVPVYSYKKWPGRDSWLEAKRIYDAAWEHELALPKDERTDAENFALGALDRYLRRLEKDGGSLGVPDLRAA